MTASERSTCRGACKQTIAEGELRFGWSKSGSKSGYSWLHFSCVKPQLFESAIAKHGSLGDIPGVAENAATERIQTAQRNAVSARNAKEAAKAREKEEKEKAKAEAKATKQAEKEAKAAAKQAEKEAKAAAKQAEKEAKAAAKKTEKDAKAAAKADAQAAKAAAKKAAAAVVARPDGNDEGESSAAAAYVNNATKKKQTAVRTTQTAIRTDDTIDEPKKPKRKGVPAERSGKAARKRTTPASSA